MGCDPVIYVNNNIFENNINYTLDKLSQKTEMNIFLPHENNYIRKDDSINVYMDDYNSVTECFLNENEIWIHIKNIGITMMEKSLCLGCDFGFGRWTEFCQFIRMDGDNDLIKYYQECIEKIKLFSSIFDSNKMVIFDTYFQQDIEDKIVEGMTIDEVIENKRWKINQKYGISNVGSSYLYELYYNEWDNRNYYNMETWRKEYL